MIPRLTDPKHHVVDACLREMEEAEERREQALRKLDERERQRPGWFLNWRDAAVYFGKAVLIAAVGWLIIALWLSL